MSESVGERKEGGNDLNDVHLLAVAEREREKERERDGERDKDGQLPVQ